VSVAMMSWQDNTGNGAQRGHQVEGTDGQTDTLMLGWHWTRATCTTFIAFIRLFNTNFSVILQSIL